MRQLIWESSLSTGPRVILIKIGRKCIRVAVGGKLLREIAGSAMASLLLELQRNGLLIKIACVDVDREEARIAGLTINSDDPHVLALAILARARLLYSDDNALIDDFKSADLINPRGKVFKSSTPPTVADVLLTRYGP